MVIAHVIADEGDVTEPIPAAALIFYRKLTNANSYIEASRAATFSAPLADKILRLRPDRQGRSQVRPPKNGGFAQYEKVLPKVKGKPAFLLDVNLLRDVQAAIGCVNTYNGKSFMVAVWPSNSPG